MAQPPQTLGYDLITEGPPQDEQQRLKQYRLFVERQAAEEKARERRQKALDAYLRSYDDDPLSQAIATVEFEDREAEAQKKAAEAARQAERDKIVSQYDDPLTQAWKLAEHDIEKESSRDVKQAQADAELYEELQERDATARKLDRLGKLGGGVADAFVRESLGAAVGVVPNLAAVPARAAEAVGLVEEGTTAELHRASGRYRQAQDQSRENDFSPWLSRMYGGAAESFLQMAGTPGGAYSKIGGAGVMSGNEALTTAEDAGLEGMAKYRYAGTQGLIEAGVAAIGQKLFGAGLESRLAGQRVAAETWKQLGKEVGKDALKEMPEEVVTAILQNVSSQMEGVSPNLTMEDYVTQSVEAAVQAAMMAGMGGAMSAPGVAFRGDQPSELTTLTDEEMAALRAQQGEGRLLTDDETPEPPPASATELPPEVDSFIKNPSRKKYEAAVKAGLLPSIGEEAKSVEGRERYAAALLRFHEDAVAQEAAAAETAAAQDVDAAPPMKAPPEIGPEDMAFVDEVQDLIRKGEEDETQGQVGQEQLQERQQAPDEREGIRREDEQGQQAGPLTEDQPLPEQIMEAIREDQQESGSVLSLVSKLRDQDRFKDVSKEDFDAAVMDLWKQKQLEPSRHDAPYHYSEEDRARQLVRRGDDYYNALALGRDVDPKPRSKVPAEAAIGEAPPDQPSTPVVADPVSFREEVKERFGAFDEQNLPTQEDLEYLEKALETKNDELDEIFTKWFEEQGLEPQHNLAPMQLDRMTGDLPHQILVREKAMRQLEAINKGHKKASPKRLMQTVNQILDGLDVDLTQEKYKPLVDPQMPNTESGVDAQSRPFTNRHTTEDGIQVQLSYTAGKAILERTEPTEPGKLPRVEEVGRKGQVPEYWLAQDDQGHAEIGDTMEEAIAKVKQAAETTKKEKAENKSRVWLSEELEQMQPKYRVRRIAKARGIEGSDKKRYKTLISEILKGQPEPKAEAAPTPPLEPSERTRSGQLLLPGMPGRAEEIEHNNFVRTHRDQLLNKLSEDNDGDARYEVAEAIGNIAETIWNQKLRNPEDIFDTEMWTNLEAAIEDSESAYRHAFLLDTADEIIRQAFELRRLYEAERKAREEVEQLQDERLDKDGIDQVREHSEEAGVQAADAGEPDEDLSATEAAEIVDAVIGEDAFRVGDVIYYRDETQAADIGNRYKDGLRGVVTKVRPGGGLNVDFERSFVGGHNVRPRFDDFRLMPDGEKVQKVGRLRYPVTLNQFYSQFGGKSEEDIKSEFAELWDSLSADEKSGFAHRLRKFGIAGAKANSKTGTLSDSVVNIITQSDDIPGKLREVYDITMEYPDLQGVFDDPEKARLSEEMYRRIDAVGLSFTGMTRAALVLKSERREMLYNEAEGRFGSEVADAMFEGTEEDADAEAEADTEEPLAEPEAEDTAELDAALLAGLMKELAPTQAPAEPAAEPDTDERWWNLELTSAGRQNFLRAAGLMQPTRVRWQNLPESAREKLRAQRAGAIDVIESPGIKKPKQAVDTRKAIADAAMKIGGEPNVRVRLSQLRAEIGDSVPRQKLDDTLQEMERNGELALYPLENPLEIKQADRDAVLRTGVGLERHILYFVGLKSEKRTQASPAVVEGKAFLDLPYQSRARFNQAFEEKNVADLQQMVEPRNKAWRAEFKKRTKVKLPRTIKGTHNAVMEWAGEAPPVAEIKEAAKKQPSYVDTLRKNFIKQKRALNKALKDGDPQRIIEVAQAGLASFEEFGYPDNWSSWDRAIYDAQLEINGPGLTVPITRPPRTGLGQATEAAKDDARAELDQALDEYRDVMGDLEIFGGLPLDPKAVAATVKLTAAAAKYGIVTFADFVTLVAERFGTATAEKLAPYLERAWTMLRQVPGYEGIDAAGKVADVLAERGAEDGTTDTGTGEGDQETGADIRLDGEITETGTGDAVLADSPAEDGQAADEAGDTAGLREGAARQDVRADEEADSGRVDAAERRGEDRGRTPADDTGERGRGTGRDRAPSLTRPNYHLTNPDAIIGGGLKAKFERNRRAIEIVRELEETGRAPTNEELDTLAGYMGWGAFGQELFKGGSWENPRPKEGWEEQDEWLRSYLGEEEWRSANDSIVNAHFTDPQTATAMWDAVRRMGFSGGRVLEPSMGVGNFFSTMPRDLMETSTLTGIELDKMSAKIAKLLHPQANIHQMGYQKSQTPNAFYDLVISNVPFGNYKIGDNRYKQDFSIHNYFFKRAFDHVKPGGVVAFLTSNTTMDGKVQARLLRAQIERDGGELISAIRLPSGAFQAYAGTKVVADLILIRKRKPGEQSRSPKWLDVVEVETPNGQKIEVNEYWLQHPENILGEMTWGHGTTSGRPGMVVDPPADLQATLDTAVESLPENVINTERSPSQDRERPNTTAMRQNSIIAQDDDLWIVKGEQLVPLIDEVGWYTKGRTNRKTGVFTPTKPETIKKKREEIEGLLDVREALREVLDKQSSSQDATEQRAELNRAYDAFVKKYGPINKSTGAAKMWLAGDPMANALYSLETEVDGKFQKRSIFTRSTVRQQKSIENPTIDDAFAMERNRTLDLDMDRIAEAAGVPVDEVIEKLVADGQIYKTAGGRYDSADVFLSGNMARKLRQLEAAKTEGVEGLEPSIEAVRIRIPTPIPYSQIESKLGATWIEASDYADFIGHLLNENTDEIQVERRINGWKVTLPRYMNRKTEATNTFGHPTINFSKLMTAAMNNASVTIMMPDPENPRSRIKDPQSTAEANAKIGELRDMFGSTWLWSGPGSPDRISRLSAVYNEEFNSTITPEFDEVPLTFEGLVLERGEEPFMLRAHQASAIWRGLVSGKGIFAHEVGTGKTLTMAGLAMESRRLGLASKPLLLAHNANSVSVRNEIQGAYPGANILYIDNLDAKRKDITLQSIATEDWDLIVVPHSMADRFQLRPETVEQLLQAEMDSLEAAALEAFEESEATDFAKGSMPADLNNISEEDMQALKEPTAKELVKERLKLRAQIDKAVQSMQKGTGVYFEDMGIDMVMVDEAHEYKKLPITTKQRIKGLNINASDKGTMLMMLTDYIRSQNNGRGVYLFTGTPITNTINEVFNMMRFVMAEEMEGANIRQWDAWFNNFAQQKNLTELSAGGTWENFDRLSSFVNLPELRQMIGQYMDLVFADNMPEFLPRPEREGRSENPVGRPYKQVNNVIVNMIPEQKAHSEQLAQRYITFRDARGRDKVRMMREPGGRHNPLVIEGEGVKLAMDPRMTGIGTKEENGTLVTDTDKFDPRDPNLKVNRMLSNAMPLYHEHPKSTQMIFLQIGYKNKATRILGRTDAGDKIKITVPAFNMAAEIKRRLIEEGVDPSEIAVFSANMSKEKRAAVAEAMRRGEIRFAIGSTQTMGTGVNAQDEMAAMHHLDAPWMPGDLEQRNGRGHRQGNKWNTIQEYRYLTEGPQDGRRWQVLLTKDKFIREFMRGDSKKRVIEMDDIDMSDDGSGSDMELTFSAAAGDPRIMQRIRLEGEVERLQRLRDNHARTITDTVNRANRKLGGIKQTRESIQHLQAMHDTWAANRTETPEITIRGRKYVGAKDIKDQLDEFAERYKNAVHPRTEFGEYRGLPMFIDNGQIFLGTGEARGGEPTPKTVTARWSLNSLQSIMSNLPERINKLETGIEKDERFIAMANQSVGQPFPKQEQLDRKTKQLATLREEMDRESGRCSAMAASWRTDRHRCVLEGRALHGGRAPRRPHNSV
jgi:N12 class adenine-specific DNA methylase